MYNDNPFIQLKVNRRAQLIAGLAQTGIIPNTVLVGFKDKLIPSTELFRVTHNEIFSLIQRHIKFKGTTDDVFKEAFSYLWFHFPQDLTGFDKKLKLITLEERI